MSLIKHAYTGMNYVSNKACLYGHEFVQLSRKQ